MPRCGPGGSEVMVARRSPSRDGADRGGAASRSGVGGSSQAVAPGDRAYLVWPVRVVVVDDLMRPERAAPLLAGVSCRRDDLGAAQHGQGDHQAARDSAGSVDQDLLARADRERFRKDLLGGQRRQDSSRPVGPSARRPAGAAGLLGLRGGSGLERDLSLVQDSGGVHDDREREPGVLAV
jgi:hypothetical protein